MQIELTATVALELYRESIITKAELRHIFGFDGQETTPKREWHIGQKVEGNEAYRSLPVGAVAGGLTRTENGFLNEVGGSWSVDAPFSPRKITHLPS